MPLPETAEQGRLAALRHLDILNTPREKQFDDVAGLAARFFSAPIALISLVEDTHQWFKACVGLPVNGTSRDVSFCAHAIQRPDVNEVFVVRDATKDPRFCDNPLVTGEPHIRFYAGAALVTSDGHAIGSLCVIDTVPREPTPDELDALKILAQSTVAQMELRKAAEDLRASEQAVRSILDAASEAVVTVDSKLFVTQWNSGAESTFGISRDNAIGQSIKSLVLPPTSSEKEQAFIDLFDHPPSCSADHLDIDLQDSNGLPFPAEISIAVWEDRGTKLTTAFIRDIANRKRAEAERVEAETRDVVIYAMARLAESRDPETGAHLERVQHYCQVLAEQLAAEGPYRDLADPEFVRLMYTTSPLHDIGKVGIPDDILLKPGRLSDREFEIMKSHATIGAQTLEAAMQKFPKTRFLRMARNIAATHHERFDGSGYPNGLMGDQIPLCGRIVALADVYDALTSRRVYKAAFTDEIARGIILKESGKQFDPVIVDAFLKCEERFQEIRRKFDDSQTTAEAA